MFLLINLQRQDKSSQSHHERPFCFFIIFYVKGRFLLLIKSSVLAVWGPQQVGLNRVTDYFMEQRPQNIFTEKNGNRAEKKLNVRL